MIAMLLRNFSFVRVQDFFAVPGPNPASGICRVRPQIPAGIHLMGQNTPVFPPKRGKITRLASAPGKLYLFSGHYLEMSKTPLYEEHNTKYIIIIAIIAIFALYIVFNSLRICVFLMARHYI
ncbi:MAG: hypothetical protein RR288_02400 [Oscillibacter sp.]